MRHRKQGVTLDRKKAPRKALLQHVAESLIYHERIITTRARAKAAQRFVERLITIGKRPTVANRRRLLTMLPKPQAVRKLLEVVSPRYQGRHGGYTRCIRTGSRQGDNAEMAALQFVEEELE